MKNIKGIQIGKPKPRRQPIRDWEEEAALCLEINLANLYADTSVMRVGFKPHCARAIQDWAIASILTDAPTPEVGGLLLGGYRELEGRYELIIDCFAPIRELEAQSNVRLVVGSGYPKAIQEAEADNPDLLVLGWFHTHPGHTPYLSSTDVNQTHLFFSAPYQIAMVLDSLTDVFYTGIFSRRTDGTVHQALEPSKWIPWKHFVDETQLNQ